jgi:hypothetical protein
MIVLKRKFVRMAELWFDEPTSAVSADIRVYYHWSHSVSERTQEFQSVELDLTQDAKSLLADMTDTNRYEINRAGARDSVLFQAYDDITDAQLTQFCDFFDGFASDRGIAKAARDWLTTYAAAGHLTLSSVSAAAGDTLAWHSYYRDARVARQMQSASYFRSNDDPEFRKLMSRASRFHYWQDILHFKQAGLSAFDFGGWYAGTEDVQKLRINKFKESFGGAITKRYYCVNAQTWKGKLYLSGVERLRGAPFFPHMV